MRGLRDGGYELISLQQVEGFLKEGLELPAKAVAITLDDGFADNFSDALPILQRHAIPATMFLAHDAVGGDNRWMHTRGFSRGPMLDWNQIAEMQSAGISFGSHTLSHPRLPQLDRDRASVEICYAKQALEQRLQRPIKRFAYPYGDWCQETVVLVREVDHSLACSTRSGFNRRDVDPLLLRRIEAYGTDSRRQLLRKLRFGTNNGRLAVAAGYYFRRAAARIAGSRAEATRRRRTALPILPDAVPPYNLRSSQQAELHEQPNHTGARLLYHRLYL